jgi:Phage integrase family
MLRHDCGYELANKRHDTRAWQAWLGHLNIQHTVRYTELAPDRFRISGGNEIAEALGIDRASMCRVLELANMLGVTAAMTFLRQINIAVDFEFEIDAGDCDDSLSW